VAATLANMAEEVVTQVIIDTVRDKAITFVLDRLVTDVAPFLGVAHALLDAITGGEQRARVRHAIAALMLALAGRSDDEEEVGAKVLGDLMGEEFFQEVIAALVRATRSGLSTHKEPEHTPNPAAPDTHTEPPRTHDAHPPSPATAQPQDTRS